MTETAGAGGGTNLVPDVDVGVNPTIAYQTFEGWGTSLCWFGNTVGGLSDTTRNALTDLLFDASAGLALNVVRYNIGGGDAPGHNHMGYDNQMPGFRPMEGGAYDWNADANQRWVLDAARVRIDPNLLVLEAFSNSPPYWMTVSGCASGAVGGGNNLKGDYYDDFADYLSEVVLHFRDAGIEFRSLEPLNEPNANWWNAEGGQEGCHFDRPNQVTLLNEVRGSLDAKGMSAVELAAADESSFDEAVASYNAYGAAGQALVQQINTHAYSGSQRAELLALAERDGKRLWASEVDGSGAPAPFDVYPHNHDDIVPGLDIANRITRDLKELQPHAWVLWQAIENEQAQATANKNWGLIHVDFQGGDEAYSMTKKYYAVQQYTRAIRPGSTMIEVNQADAVAFLSEGTLAIVQRNAATESHTYGYDLAAFGAPGSSAQVWRTSASENFEALPALTIRDGRLVAEIASQSITSFVISGVAP